MAKKKAVKRETKKAAAEAPAEEAPKKKRGVKTCPKCDRQLGVRTRVCDCGHVFPMKIKKAADETAPPRARRRKKTAASQTDDLATKLQAKKAALQQQIAWIDEMLG
jgi:hypothetical protein